MVIDDCGSRGFAGDLEWLDHADHRAEAVPAVKASKKRPTRADVEEWLGHNGERVVLLGGPDFQWH